MLDCLLFMSMDASDRQRPSEFLEVRRENVRVVESMSEWIGFQAQYLFESGAGRPVGTMQRLLRASPEMYLAIADCEEAHEERIPKRHRKPEWASCLWKCDGGYVIRERLLGVLFGQLHQAKSAWEVPHKELRFAVQKKKGYDERDIPPSLQIHDIVVASSESRADIRSLLLCHAEQKVMEGKLDYLFAVESVGAYDRIEQWEKDWFTVLTHTFPDGGERYWLVSQDWDKRWRPVRKDRKKG